MSVEVTDADATIGKLLPRPEIAYLHSRNVLAGCYMCRFDHSDVALDQGRTTVPSRRRTSRQLPLSGSSGSG